VRNPWLIVCCMAQLASRTGWEPGVDPVGCRSDCIMKEASDLTIDVVKALRNLSYWRIGCSAID
jgi:hypothetical protein